MIIIWRISVSRNQVYIYIYKLGCTYVEGMFLMKVDPRKKLIIAKKKVALQHSDC